ncbi:MAG: hypothetical protein GF313_09635 [Caldithrix sp.]|nr:hypothetical protein [Caldithrix sp.]
MDRKPVIFFVGLILLALIIVVFYRVSTDPFTSQPKESTNVEQQSKNNNANVHDNNQVITLYSQKCSTCHGQVGQGLAGYPSLKNTELSAKEIRQIIVNGKGEMPAFKDLTETQLSQLIQLINQF